MTIDEAIRHCEEVANSKEMESEFETDYVCYFMTNKEREECKECAADHRQLAEWLTELKELREQIQKAKSMLLDSSYTVEVMCNKISGTIGCEKCTYYNPETHNCEVRAFIFKTRAFVKEGENDA